MWLDMHPALELPQDKWQEKITRSKRSPNLQRPDQSKIYQWQVQKNLIGPTYDIVDFRRTCQKMSNPINQTLVQVVWIIIDMNGFLPYN